MTTTTTTPLTDEDLKYLANQPNTYALTNAKVLATITSLQSDLQRTREALASVPTKGGDYCPTCGRPRRDWPENFNGLCISYEHNEEDKPCPKQAVGAPAIPPTTPETNSNE
jgi:hypothetical protein